MISSPGRNRNTVRFVPPEAIPLRFPHVGFAKPGEPAWRSAQILGVRQALPETIEASVFSPDCADFTRNRAFTSRPTAKTATSQPLPSPSPAFGRSARKAILLKRFATGGMRQHRNSGVT